MSDDLSWTGFLEDSYVSLLTFVFKQVKMSESCNFIMLLKGNPCYSYDGCTKCMFQNFGQRAVFKCRDVRGNNFWE